MGRDKAEHLELMRRAARLQNEAVGHQGPGGQPAPRTRSACGHRPARRPRAWRAIDVELQELDRRPTADAAQSPDRGPTSADRKTRSARERSRAGMRRADRLDRELRERRSGLASRIEVLEGLDPELTKASAPARVRFSTDRERIPAGAASSAWSPIS